MFTLLEPWSMLLYASSKSGEGKTFLFNCASNAIRWTALFWSNSMFCFRISPLKRSISCVDFPSCTAEANCFSKPFITFFVSLIIGSFSILI